MRASFCLTFAVVFALLLSACGQAGAPATPTVTVAPPAPTHTATAVPTRTVPPSPTPTVAPTHTATPTVTPTPTSTATPAPTATPTTSPTTTATASPTPVVPPGVCVPPGNPPLPATLDDLIRDEFATEATEYDIWLGMFLYYLNQGADPEALEAALNSILVGDDETVQAALQQVNFNNDGRPDLVALLRIHWVGGEHITTALYGLICQDGGGAYRYEFRALHDPIERFTPDDGFHILAMQDLNQDGVQDIVVYERFGNARTFWILSWNGEYMAPLLEPVTDPLVFVPVTYRKVIGTLAVQDLNHDGVAEVVATLSPNDELWDDLWEHCPDGVDVYAWDGEAYRLDCTLTTP